MSAMACLPGRIRNARAACGAAPGRRGLPSGGRAEIERRARRAVSRGAVYVTLDRLEAKKLLTSRVGEDDPSQITAASPLLPASPKGVRAVRRAARRGGAYARARAAANES